MNYVKKICLLKEVHAGFSTTGKSVSAMVTLESYRGKLSISVNMIDFAPLTTGNYYVVLQNLKGQTEKVVLSQQKGYALELYSDFVIAEDFACLIASVGTTIIPIAFGKCSDKTFELAKLLQPLQREVTTAPAINYPQELIEESQSMQAEPAMAVQEQTNFVEKEQGGTVQVEQVVEHSKENWAMDEELPYDDEVVATENYYAFEEQEGEKNDTTQDGEREEVSAREIESDEDVTRLFDIAATDVIRKDETSGYYFKVKEELDKLFMQYPKEEALSSILPEAQFAKIEIATGRHYVVGILREQGAVKYICYGLPTSQKSDLPPPALRGRVSFIPLSLFDMQGKGYWMLFQSAKDGSCLSIQHG